MYLGVLRSRVQVLYYSLILLSEACSMIPLTTIALLSYLIVVVSHKGSIRSSIKRESLLGAINQMVARGTLVSRLCADKCGVLDCASYATILNSCYNGQTYFPESPDWSEFDILDEPIGLIEVRRSIFSSKDSSCTGPADTFVLPLHQCIGPFGDPRPWGSLTL